MSVNKTFFNVRSQKPRQIMEQDGRRFQETTPERNKTKQRFVSLPILQMERFVKKYKAVGLQCFLMYTLGLGKIF